MSARVGGRDPGVAGAAALLPVPPVVAVVWAIAVVAAAPMSAVVARPRTNLIMPAPRRALIVVTTGTFCKAVATAACLGDSPRYIRRRPARMRHAHATASAGADGWTRGARDGRRGGPEQPDRHRVAVG